MSAPTTIDLSCLPEPGTDVRAAMSFNAAVALRLREVAVAMADDTPLSVDATVLGAALVHRLHELYKLARKMPMDDGVRDLFQATSETLQDLAQSKPPGETCQLSAGELLALIGSSAEAA